LRWLKQAGTAINHEWVNNKIDDYYVNDYDLKLESVWQRLPEIIHGEAFKLEMARFLPMDVQERTFMKDKFCDYLTSEIRGLLDEVRRGVR
jgi:hypothetical protein